ncbi:MAG TPA: hypothetical protein VF714_11585, partial [Jatrophihabitans sp.]
RLSLFVLARPGKPELDRIYLDGRLLAGASYSAGAIRWSGPDGNGFLQTDVTARGGRRLVGASWPAGRSAASGHRVELTAQPLPRGAAGVAGPAVLTGDYTLRVATGHGPRLVRLSVGAEVTVDGHRPGTVELTGSSLRWSAGPAGLAEGRCRAVLDPITGRSMLFGTGRAEPGGRPMTLTGMVPVSPGDQRTLSAQPQLGIPDWAWEHLVELTCAASRSGGLFVYNAWQTAVLNLRMLRYVVRAVLR